MTDLKKKIEEAAKTISLAKYPVVMVDCGAGDLQTDINYPRRVHHERTFVEGADFALNEAAPVLARIAELESQVSELVQALEEIANDKEECSHERAENALWSAKAALKKVRGE